MENRGSFGTRIGVILATAGSAVGLGNVWMFPYMTGKNGGAAFILVYLGCVFLLGIPGVVAEFIIGRHAAANAARAYSRLANGTIWRVTGYLGVITSMIILGFYSVVAGWCLQYLYASLAGQLQGDHTFVTHYFARFSSDALRPALCAVVFVLLTHLVVVRGVRNGIEKASNLLMPTLFVLLVIIVAAACTLPGSADGVRFLLHPDFSKMNRGMMLDALGQAFFSLSLGTACLCTYASYFSRQTRLLRSATQIALLDTAIAILAGLMIFPAAFSVGVNPDSGPALIFITLPNVFQQAFSGVPAAGYVISVLFYFLMALAALTSTISMHEIGTAFFHEELHISRRRGAWIVTTVCCAIAILCSLSFGPIRHACLFGMTIFDFCSFLTAQILLPLGSMLTCLFLGWYVPKQLVRDEFTNKGTISARLFGVYLFAIRIICPIGIMAIFLHQFGLI